MSEDKMKINFDKAPKEGMLLAYFRDGVVFEPYKMEVLDKDENMLKGHNIETELLELHMFDEVREFRAVRSRRRKKFIPNDILPEMSGDVMVEEVLLNQTPPYSIEVVNYLDYDGFGMVKVIGYQHRKKKED